MEDLVEDLVIGCFDFLVGVLVGHLAMGKHVTACGSSRLLRLPRVVEADGALVLVDQRDVLIHLRLASAVHHLHVDFLIGIGRRLSQVGRVHHALPLVQVRSDGVVVGLLNHSRL